MVLTRATVYSMVLTRVWVSVSGVRVWVQSYGWLAELRRSCAIASESESAQPHSCAAAVTHGPNEGGPAWDRVWRPGPLTATLFHGRPEGRAWGHARPEFRLHLKCASSFTELSPSNHSRCAKVSDPRTLYTMPACKPVSMTGVITQC